MELHHRAAQHATQASEDVVVEIRRRPFDHIRPERARRGHRIGDVPPRVQGFGVEERLEDGARRRGNNGRDVEA